MTPSPRKEKKVYEKLQHYHYDKHKKKSYLVDTFGEPYYALSKEDRTKNVGVSLPLSLLKILDDERGPVSRSRFIRNKLEESLGVERIL